MRRVQVQTFQSIDRATRRRIAAAAGGLVDERTVGNYYEGRQRTQAACADVIKRALATLGIPDPHAEATP